MANTLYDFCRQRFLEAQLNWMTDTIKVILVDTGAYTPQTSVHQYLSDIPTSARIAGPITLTAKATTGGAADTENMGVLGLLVRVFVVDGTVTLTDTNSVEYAYGKSVILLPVIAGAYWESTITNNVLSGKSNAVKYEKIVLKPGQSIYTHVLGPYGTFNAGGLETNLSAGATTAVKYVVRVEGFEDTV